MEVRKEQFESWRRFVAHVFSATRPDWYAEASANIFRGHGSADWEPLTSIDRFVASHSLEDPYAIAERMSKIYRDNCGALGLDAADLEEPELSAFGQHNGLPTRLMDWTRSPFIAAFFEYRDGLSRLATEGSSRNVAIWIFNDSSHLRSEQKLMTGPRPLELITPSARGNTRLHRQMGLHLRINSGQTLIDTLRATGNLQRLTQVSLPTRDTALALADLRLMGIDEMRMFPDTEGAALEAKSRVLLDEKET